MLFSAMAEGNGEVLDESMKIEDSEKTEDYQKLIEYGLDEKVNIVIYYFKLISKQCWSVKLTFKIQFK